MAGQPQRKEIAMTKSIGLVVSILLAGSASSCNYISPEQPDTTGAATEVQLATNPMKQYWVGKYWSPNPRAYGVRTYEWLDSEEQFTSMIVGTETVPYQTGAITGVKMIFGDATFVFRTEKKRLWLLKEDEYYLSTDCDLTAYPDNKIFGRVFDGIIHDMSASVWEVNDDFSDCRPVPMGDSWVNFVQIRDVFINKKRYSNALVFWELEPGEPFKAINFFDGYEQEMGLTLPTASDTNGWAVDDIIIFGFKKGILAVGDIRLATGNLEDLAVLVSVSHHSHASPPPVTE